MGAVVAALAATLVAASPAAASTLSGAVGGLRSNVQGTLPLDIRATSGGAHLANAVVVVDNVPFTLKIHGTDTTLQSVPLCDPAGSCDVGAVNNLDFDSKALSFGHHHLQVVVSDVAGASAPIADQDIDVDNTERPYSRSVSVSLAIGSDVTFPPPPPPPSSGGSGGVLGAAAGSCVSPKLSMLLAQKPVRIHKGVAVLVRGRTYRFTGRLTCLVRNKRVSAPKRTRIQIFAIVKGRSASKGTALVGSRGKLSIRLASPSARTLEFRFRNTDGKIARVRIKVETVKPPRRHKAK